MPLPLIDGDVGRAGTERTGARGGEPPGERGGNIAWVGMAHITRRTITKRSIYTETDYKDPIIAKECDHDDLVDPLQTLRASLQGAPLSLLDDVVAERATAASADCGVVCDGVPLQTTKKIQRSDR